MVQVSSTWFPLIDRNPQKYVPNIFEAKDDDFQPARQRVFRSAKHPSHLELQVLPGTGQSGGSWVGQKALARKAGTSLNGVIRDGKRIKMPVQHIVYTVVADVGRRILVNYPGQEGWADKSDWVRLSDAMAHFSRRVEKDPNDAFAWSRRGVAWRYAGKPDLVLEGFARGGSAGTEGLRHRRHSRHDVVGEQGLRSCDRRLHASGSARSNLCGRPPESGASRGMRRDSWTRRLRITTSRPRSIRTTRRHFTTGP